MIDEHNRDGGQASHRPGPPLDTLPHLRRLRLAALILPPLFIIVLALLRPRLVDAIGGDTAHVVFSAVAVVAAVLFGIAVFGLVERLHEAAVSRNLTLHVVNEVTTAIARREPLGDVLHLLARRARELLGAERSGICLHPSSVQVSGDLPTNGCGIGVALPSGPHAGCPVHNDEAVPMCVVPVLGQDESLGRIWASFPVGAQVPADAPKVLGAIADLAVVAVDHAHTIERDRREAVVGERDRIAREMHDSLAQALGAVHLRLRALEGAPSLADRPEARTEIGGIADTCRAAYQDVREGILGLRESGGSDRSLVESLGAYVAHFSRQSGIETILVSGTEPVLPPQSEVHVIRIVQEALTNVRKHAAARRATVLFEEDQHRTLIEISDDGSGFDPATVAAGGDTFGLRSMRERAEIIGGRLHLDSAPGRGTRVRLELPRLTGVIVEGGQA